MSMLKPASSRTPVTLWCILVYSSLFKIPHQRWVPPVFARARNIARESKILNLVASKFYRGTDIHSPTIAPIYTMMPGCGWREMQYWWIRTLFIEAGSMTCRGVQIEQSSFLPSRRGHGILMVEFRSTPYQPHCHRRYGDGACTMIIGM